MQFSIFLMIISAINSSIILLSGNEDLRDFLALSIVSPWGVVTSSFVHEDFQHMYDNFLGFPLGLAALICCLFILSLCFYLTKDIVNKAKEGFIRDSLEMLFSVSVHSGFFLGLAFILGLFIPKVAFLIWCLLSNLRWRALGISSANYSLLGLLVAYIMYFMLWIVTFLSANLDSRKKHFTIILGVVFAAIYVCFLLSFIFESRTIIGSFKERIDVFSHIVGLFTGLFTGLFSCVYSVKKQSKLLKPL